MTHAVLEPWVSPTVSFSITGGCGLGSDARSEGHPCLLGCPLALPGHTRARVSGVTRVKPGVACRVFPRVLLALRGARQRCSGRSGAGADPCEFGAAIAAARVCHEQAGGSGKRGKKSVFSCELPILSTKGWHFVFQKLPHSSWDLASTKFGLGASSLASLSSY